MTIPKTYRSLIVASFILNLMVFYYLVDLNSKTDLLLARMRHLVADDILEDSAQEAAAILAIDKMKKEDNILQYDLHFHNMRSSKAPPPPLLKEVSNKGDEAAERILSQGTNMSHPKVPDAGELEMPRLNGENVISMSLWGSEHRYTVGAVRNAELVKSFFPGWKIRIYLEEPSEHSVHGDVPVNILQKLRDLDVQLYFMEPHSTKIPPMMWRFLIADDMSVDRFIVRDTDSRLSNRDAVAVYQWVQSDAAFGCIRDHPSHASFPLSGGMWGGKPSGLREIFRRTWKDLMYGYGKAYGQDMDFLNKVVWDRVKDRCYCVDSVSCDRWPGAHPFPLHRYSHEHVGQIFDENEIAKPVDIGIMAKSVVNEKCVPPRKKKTTPQELTNSTRT